MKLRTVGVEEELLLVDRSAHRAAPLADQVLAESAANGEHPLEHEFKQEQVEIGSSPQANMTDLTADLIELRAVAAHAAQARQSEIAAVATNPWKLSPQSTIGSRYQRMTEEFGLLAREQLTCGQHVHVSIESRDEGVAVLDRIRGWLPLLLAVSANSPFWQGQDTNYCSFRSVLWGRWPTAGPTEIFGDVAGYDQAVAQLIETGAALDDGMIYFDARLSAHYPTLEIRVADVCTNVHDAVLIAALARGLVDTAAQAWRDDSPVPPVRTAILRAATWRAARWGLAGTLVDPRTGRPTPAHDLLADLVATLGPALARTGDADLVAAGLARLRQGDSGAVRQRAAFAHRASLDDVVADAALRTLQP